MSNGLGAPAIVARSFLGRRRDAFWTSVALAIRPSACSVCVCVCVCGCGCVRVRPARMVDRDLSERVCKGGRVAGRTSLLQHGGAAADGERRRARRRPAPPPAPPVRAPILCLFFFLSPIDLSQRARAFTRSLSPVRHQAPFTAASRRARRARSAAGGAEPPPPPSPPAPPPAAAAAAAAPIRRPSASATSRS